MAKGKKYFDHDEYFSTLKELGFNSLHDAFVAKVIDADEFFTLCDSLVPRTRYGL